MFTTIISAAMAAAITAGVCFTAYRTGKQEGNNEAKQKALLEKLEKNPSFASDLAMLVLISSLFGFGKEDSTSPTPDFGKFAKTFTRDRENAPSV